MSHPTTTLSVRPKKTGFQPGSEGGIVGNSGRAGKIFTRDLQAKFLKRYAKCMDVERAARKVGFRKSTIYNQLHRSARFQAEFDAVRTAQVADLEVKMIRFAHGIETPVHGAQLTSMFGVLKAFKPERWRENAKLTLGAEGDLATFFSGMSLALANTQNPPLEHETTPALEAPQS